MKTLLICILIGFIIVEPVRGQESSQKYIYKNASTDGTGKWYMGREIAHVMGYQGMRWLERPERDLEENATKLLQNMRIRSGDIVADIGAGSGYHVFKMTEFIRKGNIYAVDIQDEMLAALRKKKAEKSINNLKIIKGSVTSVNLPGNAVDKVLMVDVYHEFSHPVEMLASVHEALKPGGLLYLIEYRAEDRSVPIKELHKMTEEQAIGELEANGFKFQKNIRNLPWQHCLVFTKN